jgi:hypothetical protein
MNSESAFLSPTGQAGAIFTHMPRSAVDRTPLNAPAISGLAKLDQNGASTLIQDG